MVDLSPEELERIKLEELRKIEEIEKQNREKKQRLQEELQKIEAARKSQDAPEEEKKAGDDSEKIREEIRTKEMISRGYIKYEGEWVPRDEADRLAREKEEKAREEEDKLSKAKQRKIDREKATYEDFKALNILFIKFCSIASYVGVTLLIIGVIATTAITFFMRNFLIYWFPSAIMACAGAVLFMVTFYLLVEAEAKLIEKSYFVMDGERHEFENEEEITDYARKAARSMARNVNLKLKSGV